MKMCNIECEQKDSFYYPRGNDVYFIEQVFFFFFPTEFQAEVLSNFFRGKLIRGITLIKKWSLFKTIVARWW